MGASWTETLLVVLLIIYATSVLFALAYAFAYLGRAPRRLPVYGTVDPNARIILLCMLIPNVVGPIASLTTEPRTPYLFAFVTLSVIPGLIGTYLITTRDVRRYRRLLTAGRRATLRVLAKSTPTHGGTQPDFILTAGSEELGPRELEVQPGTFHSFHVGEPLELLYDPQDTRCWQILPKECVADR